MVSVRFASLALLASIAGTVEAQTVYRCGNRYSQVPCPEGRIVEATDPRTAAQRAAAKRVAAQERNLATQMERDRRAQEAAQPPAGAAGFDSRASAAEAAASAPHQGRIGKERGKERAKKRGKAQPEDFTAVDPQSTRARRK